MIFTVKLGMLQVHDIEISLRNGLVVREARAVVGLGGEP